MGFFGGDPDKVRMARVDTVLNVVAYSSFISEIESVARELNKTEK
jgi:hypothetical protein